MGGAEVIAYVIMVRTAIIDEVGTGNIAADLERLTMWLVDPENRDKPVGEVIRRL